MAHTTPYVLSDLITFPKVLHRSRVRDAVLVLGGALFTALCAQVVVHLGFTPVPLTGQTFAVLTVGSILGSRRAMASQALYWALGAIGLPFYASATGGWERATGSTFGYFIGFVLASGIVGWFADRRNDRNYITSLSSLVFASSIIYACGAVWLSHSLNIPLAQGEGSAIELGVSPFLVGDAIKIALAATVAPLGWAAYYSRPR
ncbi:MAG: biotin transporter BioY [Acidimicrobiaceae bacterium]|jgi:biotin transport system substrate-specific component|nr:biotin transporter BioY [Ilumatobacteraceae bacterium]